MGVRAAGVAGFGGPEGDETAMGAEEDKVQPGVHEEHDGNDNPCQSKVR